MKNSYKYLISMLAMFIFISAFNVQLNAQQEIDFSFANPQVIGGYFEFDIKAASPTQDTHFKLAQVYIDYNIDAFGSNVASNVNFLVTKGSLLATVDGTGFDQGIYTVQWQNNTTSRFNIANNWTYDNEGGGSTAFDASNVLGSSPQVWVHVKIPILDPTKLSGLSFNTGVTGFGDQQFYFNTDGAINTPAQDQAAATNYSTVNVVNGLNSPTPVELSSFSASVNQNAVNLKWQTKTEVNNYGFEVERKIGNGKFVDGGWEKIGFIPGNGNSNSPKDYSLTDKNPSGGSKFIYRLKQIDNDGKFKYSEEVEIELVPNEFNLFQNYPNPFNPATNIKFALPKAARVNITIYNVLGENIATLLNEDKEAGFYNIQFDASSYSSGVYVYRLTTEDFVQTKKMNLIK